jgi:hypothetical protein
VIVTSVRLHLGEASVRRLQRERLVEGRHVTGGHWTAVPASPGSRSDWYRVRRAVNRMPTGDALGIAACLSAAVEGSVPAANGDGLVLEADLGDGWHRI